MNALPTVLYSVVVYAGVVAGFRSLQLSSTRTQHESLAVVLRPPPWATLALIIVIGVPSVLQQFFPRLLTALERNWALIQRGQLWRLATSLLVQDGGIAGTVFNLVSLLLIGAVAEKLWGSRRLLLIFIVSGVLAQLFGFLWQPVGAGNSVANFGLAAATVVLCLRRSPPTLVRALAGAVLLAGLALLLLRNIHGGAVLLGAVLGLVLSGTSRQASQPTTG